MCWVLMFQIVTDLHLIGCFPILCLLVVVRADVGTSSTTTWWRSSTWTMRPWSTSALVESTAPKFTTNVSDTQLLNLKCMCISTAEHINFTVRVSVPTANPYPDVRRRYWNAYMLFYQKISDQNSPVLPKKSRVSIMRQEAEDLTLWVNLQLYTYTLYVFNHVSLYSWRK